MEAVSDAGPPPPAHTHTRVGFHTGALCAQWVPVSRLPAEVQKVTRVEFAFRRRENIRTAPRWREAAWLRGCLGEKMAPVRKMDPSSDGGNQRAASRPAGASLFICRL